MIRRFSWARASRSAAELKPPHGDEDAHVLVAEQSHERTQTLNTELGVALTFHLHLDPGAGCTERINDVLPTLLDERIADFRRDTHPEREIEIWERIVSAHHELTQERQFVTTSKREILSVLVGLTMGIEPDDLLHQQPQIDPELINMAATALEEATKNSSHD